MMKYRGQEGWLVLEDITISGLDEVKYFTMIKYNVTFDTKPMMHHLYVQGNLAVLHSDASRVIFSLG
jgi:hypothetical protein